MQSMTGAEKAMEAALHTLDGHQVQMSVNICTVSFVLSICDVNVTSEERVGQLRNMCVQFLSKKCLKKHATWNHLSMYRTCVYNF